MPEQKNAENISRHEAVLEFLEKQIIVNSQLAGEGIKALSDKLDAMDTKWDARFIAYEAAHKKEMKTLQETQLEDAKDLAALKNKGAGVLAAIGVVFTATATIFSDFFSALKDIIFG